MNLTVGAKTDPGRRANNEDQLAVVDVRRLHLRADAVLVIADGMGGRNFGERAASAAVETVQDTLVDMLHRDRAESVGVSDALDAALRKANSRVYEVAGQAEESRGMGTTLVVAVVEGDRLFLAHAGDSRAYLLRGQQLVRLTDDHSYVAEQVRAGTLTEESARRSRFRNVITRAVGIEPTIAPELGEHDVQAGDWLLLCTDGLSNMVAEPEIVQTLTHVSSAQDAADKLVLIANRNGGRDNITAIVARLESGNRTQRMRKSDLAQASDDTENSDKHADDETPTVLPLSRASVPSTAPAQFSLPRYEARRVRSVRGQTALLAGLSVLLLASLAGVTALAHILDNDGYHFQASWPLAFKPSPPPPPAPPDLAHLTYGAPAMFLPIPMQGGLLTLNPSDNTLTALSVSGQVLHLSGDGKVLYKYPLPKASALAATAPPGQLRVPGLIAALPAPTQPVHWASDPQGNLYVADALRHTLRKYTADGILLHLVAPGLLKQPEAVAVTADGTIYVIDAQRLKIIRPRPAGGSFLFTQPVPGL